MILALTSSTDFFSVGIFDHHHCLLGETSFFTKKLQQTGFEAVDNLLKKVNQSLEQCAEICVDTGPGMFTGLRIGVAMAKTFAFALKKPMREACSLDLIKTNLPYQNQGIISVLDGKQGRVFAKIFNPDQTFSEVLDIEPSELFKMIQDQNLKDYICIGNGILSYPELKNKNFDYKEDWLYPSARNFPKIWSDLKDYTDINARYYRISQAEANFQDKLI